MLLYNNPSLGHQLQSWPVKWPDTGAEKWDVWKSKPDTNVEEWDTDVEEWDVWESKTDFRKVT